MLLFMFKQKNVMQEKFYCLVGYNTVVLGKYEEEDNVNSFDLGIECFRICQ